MKQLILYSVIVLSALACQQGESTNDKELSEEELEEMDQKVDDIIQEDQERYDSMKKELGL
ncbi:MAG: hypothetical protein JXR19_05440 [Bacteroidia bacterium]